MQKLWIAHDTWILVGDGRKALVLQNSGTPQEPSLTVLDVLKDSGNPPTRAQGTDQPGRVVQSRVTQSDTGRRSSVEQTDWHEIAEIKFAETVASRLNAAAQENRFDKLILVAPPHTLAALRKNLDSKTAQHVVAEVAKDLTKHPVHEIARVLTGG